MRKNSGFSAFELLLLVAIISVFVGIGFRFIGNQTGSAKEVRAKNDLLAIESAINAFEKDTGQTLNRLNARGCVDDGNADEFYLEDSWLLRQFGSHSFSNWKGPYLTEIPPDPWGNPYIYDNDYSCAGSPTGCQGIDPNPLLYHRAIYSTGPNATGFFRTDANVYDSDNIVIILCKNSLDSRGTIR